MDHVLPYLIGALGFIGAFGLAVFIHELGHFLAAKAFRVPVSRFVIGMDSHFIPALPNCIWERKIGETTYGVSLVPLGGYVKMEGIVHPEIEKYLEGTEGDTNAGGIMESTVSDINALYRRPFWQKLIIYSGGVAMNFLLAMGVLVIVGMRGVEVSDPVPSVIGWTEPGDPVFEAGLRQGDTVKAIGEDPVANEDDFYLAVARRSAAQQDGVPVTVARGAEQLSVTLSREQWTAIMQRPAYLFAHPAHVGAVVPNGPADKAGIRARDTFISIDGEPVDDWNEMRSIIGKSANRELTVVVRRWQAGEETLALTPWESASTRGRGEIRISPGNPDFRIVKKTFSEAVAEAPSLVLLNIGRYVENVKALITRIVTRLNVKEAHRELSGPVGIAQVAARAANEGMDAWLRFIVMFNIALGVMNALPLPVLDGGHIVFAAYEGIFRRPLAPRIFVPVMNGAIIAFLCFFVLITLSDVVKIAK